MPLMETFLNTGCIDSSMVFKENHEPWNKGLKGIHLSPKSEFTTERTIGSNNVNWKEEGVSYVGLHQWIRRHKIKAISCENCNKNNCMLHAANISGEYKRDINDYRWLCVSCHKNIDYLKNPYNSKQENRKKNSEGVKRYWMRRKASEIENSSS